MTIQHAKLSPSGASRWLTCTKSPEACQGLKDKTSVYAQEGTEAHELLEKWRKEGRPAIDTVLGSELEKIEAVTKAYNYIEELKQQDPGSIEMNETTMGPGILGDDVWGTADVIMYQPAFKTLHVIDYKHGKGVAVDLPSSQLEIYAILAKEAFAWMFGEVESVQTTIIQPRAIHGDGPIRSQNYTPEGLELIAIDMQMAIRKIGTDAAEYAPSESACRWCLAKATCEALQEQALAAAQMTFAEIPKKEEALEVAKSDLEIFFDNRKLIDLWLSAMDARILDSLMAGDKIGDLKVVQGRLGNRRWKSNDDEIKAILKSECKLKPKEMVTEKLRSVKQIEDLLHEKPARGREKKLAALADLITRSPGKPTVARGDDKRPSIAPQFEDLTKGA